MKTIKTKRKNKKAGYSNVTIGGNDAGEQEAEEAEVGPPSPEGW